MKTTIRLAALLAMTLVATVQAQMIPPGAGGGGGVVINPTYPPADTNFVIHLVGTNIVLDWKSGTNKIYLLEHRAMLADDTRWSELQNYYLSAAGTNRTHFVHTNILQSRSMNFYRLFDVTPAAHDDFFTIDQDSADNQLDIFQNDFCPNDDRIFISSLKPAHHGDIAYSLDASVFQYKPESGFYGVDSFSYTVTSGFGDISTNANVTVFVNQSGNTAPSVADVLITLQTNTYVATFNALTNAVDPDGDTNVLFSVGLPGLGGVTNDASGNITYTRNPSLFGQDAFTYVVTDGKGGYGVGHVRILQQDTTGSGLPDQWNLNNGFDPTTDNSLADPDGDSLPNLAELAFGTNPNVADNPLNFSGVTNGTQVSDFVHLSLYGVNSSVQNPPITLFVNGAPAENAFLQRTPDGQWQMNWDTTFLTNGDYQIQLESSVAPANSPDSITDIFGTNKTVQVYNPIIFDKLTRKFGDFVFITGKLAETNDTYDVYLYDDDGNLLVYAAGLSAPNGQIGLYWDLTDGNGNQLSFGNIQAVFELHTPSSLHGVHLNGISNPSPVHHWFLKEIANSGGPFALAWGFDTYNFAFNSYREELMGDGVINILGNPSDPNEYFLLPAANIPYGGSSFRYDSESDKAILMRALNISENFFWFGHGGDHTFYGNPLRSAVGTTDVTDKLGNYGYMSSAKHPQNDHHPYKLVILNACETYSSVWAGAFGVDFSANGSLDSVYDYEYVGRMPQAFVGWTKEIGVPGANDLFWEGILDADYGDALAYMFGDWMARLPTISMHE